MLPGTRTDHHVATHFFHSCHRVTSLWSASIELVQQKLSCGEILHVINFHVEKALHLRKVKKICNVEK